MPAPMIATDLFTFVRSQFVFDKVSKIKPRSYFACITRSRTTGKRSFGKNLTTLTIRPIAAHSWADLVEHVQHFAAMGSWMKRVRVFFEFLIFWVCNHSLDYIFLSAEKITQLRLYE